MNAAVDTSRTENQRRRPLSLAHKRGAAGDIDASQPLAVLIRVPNLDAPRPTPRAATKTEVKSEAAPTTETAARTSTRTKSSTTATTSKAPTPSKTSNLVGWVWRMMILAAAVGLVMLAYRIINGPANSPEGEPAPASANIVAETQDTNITPAPAPQASDIAAPSTLAPPKLELETPPVQVTPVDNGAGETQPPVDSAENIADRDDDVPHEERRPWANNVRMEQPRGDESIRTARSEWDDGWDRGAGNRQPPSDNGPAVQNNDNYEATDEPAGNYDYPETSPHSYRAEGQWESTPRGTAPQQPYGDQNGYGAPQNSGAPQYNNAPPYNGTQYNGTGNPAWNEPAHSAMRPRESGVARLRGEIEQPPLRRDDERNRPGVY